jgi:endonuclease/exonuclease/phosphatase family metal-dependent hydrolase
VCLVGATPALAYPTLQRSQDSDAPEEILPFELGVMTFNIRTSEGRDGNNAWPYRKQLLAETIRLHSPDVMGLQEALTDQLDYLQQEFPEYRWFGIDRGLNGGTGLSEFTPIFYRHAELSPLESGTFWLSDTPDGPTRGRRAGRIATWARFRHLESGRDVYVFNTHLSVRRNEGQVESVERILSRIAELPGDAPVILMGDFNATAGVNETYRVAIDQGLRDSWLMAQERRGPPVTWSGFSAPVEGRDDRIDWVLVSGPIEALSVETVIHNDQGRFPSDHFPVFARLRVDVE